MRLYATIMAHTVAMAIWVMVRLGSLKRLFRPERSSAYKTRLVVRTPAKTRYMGHMSRVATVVVQYRATAIQTAYVPNAMRNRLILKACCRSSPGMIGNIRSTCQFQNS